MASPSQVTLSNFDAVSTANMFDALTIEEIPLQYSKEELLQLDVPMPAPVGLKMPKGLRRKAGTIPEADQLAVARRFTHRELVDAVEMGKITQSVLDAEMARRKMQREQRKQLRDYTFTGKMMQGDVCQGTFTLKQKKTELSQQVFTKPLSKCLILRMLEHKTYGPWWTKTIREICSREATEVEPILQKLAYSPYSAGTVEYWEDLLWGSRRKRDKFVDAFRRDEMAETQGDEPVLEETSSLAGHSNVTFLEERAVDTDSSHIGKSVSSSDQQMNMAETPWMSIKEVLEREIVVYRGTWTPTTSTQFLSLGIPKCSLLNENSFIFRQLEVMAFLRAGYEIRIQFNGNRFAAGSLLFAILPPMFEEDVSNYVPEQLFNFPHVRVDASVSNVGTLFVPFTHLLSHFPQRKGSLESDSMVTLGRLVGVMINPLRLGEGASSTLRYTIYGRFVNPEVHQTTWPINEFSYSDGIITQGEEGLFKKIVGGGLSTALGAFLSKMTGGLATGIGSVLAGLIFDYPRDPMPAEPIVNQSVGPVCYGAGIDHSIRLALTPVSQTETPAQLLGSTNGDFDMKVLMKIPSLLDTVSWLGSYQPGRLLYRMPVTPSWIPRSRVDSVDSKRAIYTPTMQAYISRAFCYWRGTLIIKLQIIKTEYNNGRLLVSYSPNVNYQQLPEDVETENVDIFNQTNAVIIDIEEQKEIEIELPYMSPRPWLRCDAFRSATSYFPSTPADPNVETAYLAESFCGVVSIFVLNSLVSPSNVPQDIDMNILLSVGDDFELAYPATLAPLNITSFGVGVAGAYEEYPFVLNTEYNPLYAVNFENKHWILALYYAGQRLFEAGKISLSATATWWFQATPEEYVGSCDEETLTWCYQAALVNEYFRLNEGETTVQTRYATALPRYIPLPSTQGLEEYTTNRVKSPIQIVSTKGHRSCEVAPQTVSENGMNLQTILRRYYCIYNSPPLYNLTGFTVVAVPVNPSYTPISRYPINTSKGSFFGEPVPMDQVAWFTKLFTYFRGSLRYKIVYDSSMFDVNAVHVPTECGQFAILNGMKEVDVTRIMSYAGVVATTQTQCSLEVEVPYASPYEQLLIDVHNKYFDLRCQNGTLFFIFRNKMRTNAKGLNPSSFQLYRSTGDDFVMNVPKSPPKVDEPQIQYGACKEGSKTLQVLYPDIVRNLGNDSQKLTLPTTTGFKKINALGKMAYCTPIDPEVPETQGLTDDLRSASSAMKSLSRIDAARVENILSNVDSSTAIMADALQDGKLKETLQSLNEVTSKIDVMLNSAESTAKNFSNVDTVTKYAVMASEVILCGTFVHHVRESLVNPSLPNFVTMAVELGLMVGLTVSETLQSLIGKVVNWAMNFELLKVPQSQGLDGANEFIDENTGIICTIVAVIGTVFYAYLFDALPSFDKIKQAIKNFFESDDVTTQGIEKSLGFSLKNVHFSVLGISALEKVYNKLIDWAHKLVYWFLDQENPEALLAKAALEVRERVLKVIKELDELDYEPNFIASLEDPLVHNRYYKLQEEVNHLTAVCTTSKIDQKVVTLMAECRKRCQQLLRRVEKERCTATTRYDPFVVCLHGDTGVGKTEFAKKIFEVYQEVMGLSKYHLLYTKSIRDQYWSGYTNQPLVLWDEFGQSREADKESIPEFMTLRGSRPVKVNMAALEDKGRDFTSQGIVLTTNTPYEDYNSIRDQEAFKRRRHVMVGMQHGPGFDANRLQRARADEFPNWEHCTFAITDNMQNRPIRANMDMHEVLDYVRARMIRWHEKQMAILAREVVDELPRGIVVKEVPQVVIDEIEQIVHEDLLLDVEENTVRYVPGNVEDDEVFYDAAGLELADIQGVGSAPAAKWIDNLFEWDLEVELSEDERFLAENFFVKLESLTPGSLLRVYRRTKQQVISAPSRLYQLALKTFSSFYERVKTFWQENPKLCKILGVLSLLVGVGAIMHFRSSNEVEHYEAGPARGQLRRVIPENAYHSGPNRTPKIKTLAEGSEDIQAMEISRKIKQYTYPISWCEGSTRSIKMSALHIGGHLILAPFHFFNHAQEGEWFQLNHRNKPVKVEFLRDRMFRCENKDWVVYNCGIRLETGKQLSKFFVEEKSLSKIRNTKCMLITRDPTDWEIDTKHGNVKPVTEFKYKDPKYGDVYIQKGWEHNLSTSAGHCGGALLVVDPSVPSPGKILGIHVAGFKDKSIGYVVLITKEQITRAVEHFGPVPGAVAVPHCVEIGLSPKLKIIPDGDFTLVGKMPDKLAPAQPLKTTLIETPFIDEVVKDLGPPLKIPAKLRQFEIGEERISPLKKAIVKYGHLTIPYPARNVKKVRNYLVHLFDQKLQHHTGKRIFSIQEAVNGLPGVEFAERLNFKSSPGWPYQMETQSPGKWHLFDDEGNIISEKLQQRLEERRAAAVQKQRVESIWRDCLKDELRPVAKVEAGKTRLFTIAPVDFTILVRQMFLDFVMAFYSAQGDNFFSAVGINPESVEWTRLYNYLAEKNSEVVAGDYECFDGKEMPEIIQLVCDIINAWYGDSEENQCIRETLFEEIIHTMQLCENTVYMTHQGNPSGNPLTTIINTIVNLCLMLLTWLEIHPQSSVDEFFQNVNFIGYGDDNILSISPNFQETFNQNSIANSLLEHNIVYTAETKTNGLVPNFRPLSEVTFLKRGFRRDQNFGNSFILPTMSKETLNSYFYYVRKSPDMQAQIQENQRSALRFAAFHGKEFYEEYLHKWQQYMRHSNLTSLHISFEEQVDAFLFGAGIFDSTALSPKAHCIGDWNETRIMPESMEGFMRITNSKPVRFVSGAIEAPFYCLAAMLGVLKQDVESEPEDDRWAVAIPSGEGKSFLVKEYPWLFKDHDELLIPEFQRRKLTLPWSASVAREIDFPKEDRRVLLVHHPNNTKRRLVGSFITPFPTFIRMNCIQRLRLSNPIKMTRSERNILLVQLCSLLEPTLVGKQNRSELTAYTHGTACLNQPVVHSLTEKRSRPLEEAPNASVLLNLNCK